MKLIFIVVPLFLLGCSTNMPSNSKKINDETDSFVKVTDKKAHAVNLVPLREKPLKTGFSEIRIWIGFGLVSPENLLILNIDDLGNISGRKVLIYEKDPADWEDAPEELAYFLDRIYSFCTVIGNYQHIESCSIKHNEIFDWSKIYQKLKALDIWYLPDESRLPKSEVTVLDGFAMVVELSDEKSYRAYHYGNPAFREDEEALKAAQIMSFIMAL